MIKVKLKRFIAMTMATMMTLSSNAFATEINLENSSANVNKHGTVTKDSGSDTFDDETTNVWQGGSITEEVRVNVDVASSFTITIPKEIVLNGNDGSATYKVKCEGDIAGDQVISVIPDTEFTLNEDGGKFTNVTVTQDDTDFTYVELNANKEYDGSLSAPQISAGNWSGSFYFNIKFKAQGLPAKIAFNNMSWADIATVSEAGKAPEYFSVGDEKELTIGSKTYHVQILGFDHDDKSDGTGKAGITVGLKEIITTMEYNPSIDCDWEGSEIRNYINNDVYNALSDDVKTVIKTVDKNSFKKYSNVINITSEKLFLLSTTEVGFSYDKIEQDVKYDIFTEDASRIKSYNNWWLRNINGYHYPYVNVNGQCRSKGNSYKDAPESFGIVPAFCI